MQIHIEIPDELESWLNEVAVETGNSPEQLARHALLQYLEDRQDYQLALEGLKSAETEGTVSIEEVMRRYGLESCTLSRCGASVWTYSIHALPPRSPASSTSAWQTGLIRVS